LRRDAKQLVDEVAAAKARGQGGKRSRAAQAVVHRVAALARASIAAVHALAAASGVAVPRGGAGETSSSHTDLVAAVLGALVLLGGAVGALVLRRRRLDVRA